MHTLQLPRRDFIKLAAGATAAATIGIPLKSRAAIKLEPLSPGIKVSLQISTDVTDEDLQFAQQLGVSYVNIPTGGRRATLETFIKLKKKVEAAGLKVWNIGNSNVHNMQEVTLNLPGRDKKIEEYKTFLRNLAKAGIFYTT
jgi:mannonate dehydratase